MDMNVIDRCTAASAAPASGSVSVTTPKVTDGHPAGRTPLMEAAQAGDVEVVRSLLASATDINAVDQHGENALMMAAAMGHQEVVGAFLAAGAEASVSTPYGWTALMFAEDWGHAEVADVLKMAGRGDEEPATALVATSSGEEPHVA